MTALLYHHNSYLSCACCNVRNLLEFASKELSSKEKEDAAAGTLSPFHIQQNAARAEKIEIRESQAAGVFLAGPNIRIPVTTAAETFSLINRGNKSRSVGR